MPVSYFAVQIHSTETPHVVAEMILRTANALKIQCSKLESLGFLELGNCRFVRFQVDLGSVVKLLDVLSQESKRSTVTNVGGSYIAKLGSRRGQIPSSTMHMAPAPGYPVMYRGTSHPLWERQFPAKA